MTDVDPEPTETPRAAPPEGAGAGEAAGTLPPLDAVDSRWWYWIAAYPLAVLLFVPLVVVAALLFVMPFVVVGPDMGPGAGPGPGVAMAVIGLVMALLVVAVLVLTFVLLVMFPIALYMDARAVGDADVGWSPDPLLYGLLGLLQLVVTPIIGLVVAVYYLYRRHEHVGVP